MSLPVATIWISRLIHTTQQQKNRNWTSKCSPLTCGGRVTAFRFIRPVVLKGRYIDGNARSTDEAVGAMHLRGILLLKIGQSQTGLCPRSPQLLALWSSKRSLLAFISCSPILICGLMLVARVVESDRTRSGESPRWR